MLQDLPTELLFEIFLYLAKDKQLLRNLALQCHRFSCATRPVLLRNVTLTIHEAPSTLRLDLFNRTVSENSELGEKVQALSLDLLRVDGTTKAKIHEIVETLLCRLSALRTLKVQDNSHPPCFKSTYLEVNSLKKLTSLTMSDVNLSLQSMTRYMFLENLSHLNVLWIRNPTPPIFDLLGWADAEWPIPTLPENKRAGSSPIALLDFGPIFHLPEEVFSEILTWPKALERFRGTIPGKDVPGRFGVSKRLSTTLSPESIARALSPTKNSLKWLELIDNDMQWPGHDESKMDLSDFKSLNKLDVPSTCFFKNYTFGRKKDGMYALLPHSLVELKVSLWQLFKPLVLTIQQQIMYDLNDCIRPDEKERAAIPTHTNNFEDPDDHFWQEPENVESYSPFDFDFSNLGNPRDLKWLLELAENKKVHFPNLKRVSLMVSLLSLASLLCRASVSLTFSGVHACSGHSAVDLSAKLSSYSIVCSAKSICRNAVEC